jgi:SSS family solute:Na+ symporter
MATLTYCDVYRRYFRPLAGERESMLVLYASTFFWGVASVGIALAMIRVDTVLDAWWNMAGVFSGGVLGLFLLGLISRRADNVAGAIAAVVGVLVIFWMTLPTLLTVPPWLRNPLSANLTIVVGTLTIFLVGLAIAQIRGGTRATGVHDELSRDR